ncbi:MAG: hypothetical protein M3159_08925, partial [Actinomycetota bacterium]|nr:hypothetical protein [Actinomycetota bacterium]
FAIGQPARDLDVVAAFPGRVPYRLTFDDDFARPGARLVGRLRQLRALTDTEEVLALTARRPGAGGHLALVLTANGVRRTYPLDDSSAPGTVYQEKLVVSPGGATLAGRVPTSEAPAADQGMRVQLVQSATAGGDPVSVSSQSFPLRLNGATVTMLVPSGPSWTAGSPAAPVLEVAL